VRSRFETCSNLASNSATRRSEDFAFFDISVFFIGPVADRAISQSGPLAELPRANVSQIVQVLFDGGDDVPELRVSTFYSFTPFPLPFG